MIRRVVETMDDRVFNVLKLFDANGKEVNDVSEVDHILIELAEGETTVGWVRPSYIYAIH